MKKLNFLIIAAVFASFAALLGGCCHAEVFLEAYPQKAPASTEPGTMVPAVTGRAYNSGYYLFNIWPIYTGHPEHYNRKDYHSFWDDIRPSRNATMLLQAMQKKYKVEKLTEVEHSESSWGCFSLWIIWRKTITTTAIGMRRYTTPKKKKSKLL